MLLIEEEMQVAPHDSGRHFTGDKTESSVSVLHAKHVRKENIEMSIKKNNKRIYGRLFPCTESFRRRCIVWNGIL